jgi:hypothetical protein
MSGLQSELVNVVCEFLEAALHVILHARGTYPAEAFERSRIYATQIQRCRHPQVLAYIGGVVAKLRVSEWLPLAQHSMLLLSQPPVPARRLQPLLLSGALSEVAVCFLDDKAKPAQRVVLLLEVRTVPC